MSMIVGAIAFCSLLLLQGFLLQTAVALTGDPAPRYGRALTTAWMGGLGAMGWHWTVGAVLSLFMSATTSMILGLLASVAIVGTVARFRLRLSTGHALLVAALYTAASQLAWYAWNYVF